MIGRCLRGYASGKIQRIGNWFCSSRWWEKSRRWRRAAASTTALACEPFFIFNIFPFSSPSMLESIRRSLLATALLFSWHLVFAADYGVGFHLSLDYGYDQLCFVEIMLMASYIVLPASTFLTDPLSTLRRFQAAQTTNR